MKKMLINVDSPEESRVAIVKVDGNRRPELLEIYIERVSSRTILGNIYKGIIVNIEPSIQAAFVDCGEGQNGFLHVSDVMPTYGKVHEEAGNGQGRRDRKIQDLLQLGQEVLVRVSKEQIGDKGATLTTYLSIPGRGVVLMPSLADRIRVSSKIEDQRKRGRLRELVQRLDPPRGMGYILRTAAEDMTPEELEGDLRYLLDLWGKICKATRETPAPTIVYKESDLVIKTLRDVYTPDIVEVIVDSDDAFNKARGFFGIVSPHLVERIKRHDGSEGPLFIRSDIESQIDQIYEHQVPLPSGGSIVIEQTEALVAIDVNSGRNTSEEDIEETALQTNLEAAREIAKQLRLRDLGGVIINDFIDMKSVNNRKAVEKELRDLLDNDRARTKMSMISQFGIIEMTRQRVGPSVKRYTHELCPTCKGHGWVRNLESMTLLCMRRIHQGLNDKRIQKIEITANPRLRAKVMQDRSADLAELGKRYDKQVELREDAALPLNEIGVVYRNGAGKLFELKS
jgi:ribonuclease E